MQQRKIGIIMNGVTGRFGANQHLARSIMAIIEQGGVELETGEVIIPDPILVGRNQHKLETLANEHGLNGTSTNLSACLADPYNEIYFDALPTHLRVQSVRQALEHGKHVYCEKPSANKLEDALTLYQAARKANVKHGVVQNMLFLPGLLKLKQLVDSSFFGRILSIRGEFGYWVFDGYDQPAQRPAWNYRKEDGGGIIMDVFGHWRYILENLFAPVQAISCLATTHIDKRVDEKGNNYTCSAEDAAYAMYQLENDIVCTFNSSWSVRVRRDDLLTLQVDGTEGSAVAGLRDCWIQHKATTPKPVWNPDIESLIDYNDHWQIIPDNQIYDNAFKVQWELFLKHVAANVSFPWDFREGAKGVQIAELATRSWQQKQWVNVPDLAD